MISNGMVDMPYTEKQRKAMWAEINRRKKGKKKLFKGMSLAQLKKHAKGKLKKKRKKK